MYCIVQEVTMSWTQLSNFHFTSLRPGTLIIILEKDELSAWNAVA